MCRKLIINHIILLLKAFVFFCAIVSIKCISNTYIDPKNEQRFIWKNEVLLGHSFINKVTY